MSDPRCAYPWCECDGPDGPACGLPGYAEMMSQPKITGEQWAKIDELTDSRSSPYMDVDDGNRHALYYVDGIPVCLSTCPARPPHELPRLPHFHVVVDTRQQG